MTNRCALPRRMSSKYSSILPPISDRYELFQPQICSVLYTLFDWQIFLSCLQLLLAHRKVWCYTSCGCCVGQSFSYLLLYIRRMSVDMKIVSTNFADNFKDTNYCYLDLVDFIIEKTFNNIFKYLLIIYSHVFHKPCFTGTVSTLPLVLSTEGHKMQFQIYLTP